MQSSIFRLPKDCFNKYHLVCFTGSDLGLIILEWNDVSEDEDVVQANEQSTSEDDENFHTQKTQFRLEKTLN